MNATVDLNISESNTQNISDILSSNELCNEKPPLDERVAAAFSNCIEQKSERPTTPEIVKKPLPLPQIEGQWNAPEINKEGRIRFGSREYGSHEGAIYIFLNKEKGSCYVGRTGTAISDRLSSHNSQINDSSTEGLYQDIRENPNAFSFAVLKLLDPAIVEDTSALEQTSIAHLGTLGYTLYNNDSGGGGGHPLPKENSFDPLKESPIKLRTLSPGRTHMKTTPTKLYPMTEDGFSITPNGKRQKGVYCLINQQSGKRYIGRTDRSFETRVSEHARCKKKRKLYEDMRENPENFVAGMLYDRAEGDPSSASLETYATRKAKERSAQLYNERVGGGGTTRAASRSAHQEESL